MLKEWESVTTLFARVILAPQNRNKGIFSQFGNNHAR
jgi:hypothetical protein